MRTDERTEYEAWERQPNEEELRAVEEVTREELESSEVADALSAYLRAAGEIPLLTPEAHQIISEYLNQDFCEDERNDVNDHK